MKRVMITLCALVSEAFCMTVNTYEHSLPIDHFPGKSSGFESGFEGLQHSMAFTASRALSDHEKEQIKVLESMGVGSYFTHIHNETGDKTGPVGIYWSREKFEFGDLSVVWDINADYLSSELDFPIVQELNLLNQAPSEALLRFIGKCTDLKRLALPFNSEPLLRDETFVLPSKLRELSVSNAALSKNLVDRLSSLEELEVLVLDTCYLPIDPNEWGDLTKLAQIKDLRIFRGTVKLYLEFLEKGHDGISRLAVSEGAFLQLGRIRRELYRSEKDASLLRNRFPNLEAATVNFEWRKKEAILRTGKHPVVVESERFEAKGGKVTFNFYQHEEESTETKK